MKVLLLAKKGIGMYDVRMDGLLIDTLQQFVTACQVCSMSVGQTQSMRKLFLEFQLSADKLESSLELEWNTTLPQRKDSCGTSSNVESMMLDAPDPNRSSLTVSREVDGLGGGMEKEVSTKIKFVQLSPKVDIGKSYDCDNCELKYSSLKALKYHCKLKHDGDGCKKDFEEVKDSVNCKLCERKFERSQMVRHLSHVHKYTKKSSQVFRGWQSIDGEKTWLPVFLERGESVPVNEMMVNCPVNDGKFEINGIVLEVAAYLDQVGEVVGNTMYVSPIKSRNEPIDLVVSVQDENCSEIEDVAVLGFNSKLKPANSSSPGLPADLEASVSLLSQSNIDEGSGADQRLCSDEAVDVCGEVEDYVSGNVFKNQVE